MQPRYTNTSDLPLALAVFLASDSYDYDPTPNTISATTLMKPLRQIILSDRLAKLPPGEVILPDIMERAANRMGASIHDSIERVWKDELSRKMALLALGIPAQVGNRVVVNPTDDYVLSHPDCIPVYMEQRLRRKVGKWTVTGKFDFAAEQQVQDFKTANVLSYKQQRNADKQIMQGSLYRWLDANPEHAVRKITKDDMIIMHIFMDWMRAMAKADPSYPQHRMLKQVLRLKSERETDAWVKHKLDLLDQYWDAPEGDIPECAGDDLWRSDPVFKYYKNGDITAKRSTKNFDTRTQAYTYMAVDMAGQGAVKEVPGMVKACGYCNAYDGCTQKDRLILNGEFDPNN
jgi:hypothetical protein